MSILRIFKLDVPQSEGEYVLEHLSVILNVYSICGTWMKSPA
jgi:hypothetical protein